MLALSPSQAKREWPGQSRIIIISIIIAATTYASSPKQGSASCNNIICLDAAAIDVHTNFG